MMTRRKWLFVAAGVGLAVALWLFKFRVWETGISNERGLALVIGVLVCARLSLIVERRFPVSGQQLGRKSN